MTGTFKARLKRFVGPGVAGKRDSAQVRVRMRRVCSSLVIRFYGNSSSRKDVLRSCLELPGN